MKVRSNKRRSKRAHKLRGGSQGFPKLGATIEAGALFSYKPTPEELDLTLEVLTTGDFPELKALYRLVGEGRIPASRVERYVYETAQRWFGDNYGFGKWFNEQLQGAKESGQVSPQEFADKSAKAVDKLYGPNTQEALSAKQVLYDLVNTAWASVSEGVASSAANVKAKYGAYRAQRTSGNTKRGREIFKQTVCIESLRKAKSILEGYTGMTEEQKQIFRRMEQLIEMDPICQSYDAEDASSDAVVQAQEAAAQGPYLAPGSEEGAIPVEPMGSMKQKSPTIIPEPSVRDLQMSRMTSRYVAGPDESRQDAILNEALVELNNIAPIIEEVQALTPAQQVDLATEATNDVDLEIFVDQLAQYKDQLQILANGQELSFNQLLDIGNYALQNGTMDQRQQFFDALDEGVRNNLLSEEQAAYFKNLVFNPLQNQLFLQDVQAASAVAVQGYTNPLKAILYFFLVLLNNALDFLGVAARRGLPNAGVPGLIGGSKRKSTRSSKKRSSKKRSMRKH